MQRAAELGVQASVLVVGPEGVGKTTAIHAAAAALGVHVVPYTCHELRVCSPEPHSTAIHVWRHFELHGNTVAHAGLKGGTLIYNM